MLISHISFSLGLIALVAGVSLYLWSVRAEIGPGIGLAKVVGVIVIILSILELIGTVYSGARWQPHHRWNNQKNNPASSSSIDSTSNSNSAGTDTTMNNQINPPTGPNTPPVPSPNPTTQPNSQH